VWTRLREESLKSLGRGANRASVPAALPA